MNFIWMKKISFIVTIEVEPRYHVILMQALTALPKFGQAHKEFLINS